VSSGHPSPIVTRPSPGLLPEALSWTSTPPSPSSKKACLRSRRPGRRLPAAPGAAMATQVPTRNLPLQGGALTPRRFRWAEQRRPIGGDLRGWLAIGKRSVPLAGHRPDPHNPGSASRSGNANPDNATTPYKTPIAGRWRVAVPGWSHRSIRGWPSRAPGPRSSVDRPIPPYDSRATSEVRST
jgi:hypothetical protein